MLIMKELLTRTVSGIVFVAVVVACVLLGPWICAALLLVVVGIGTFEMCRLHGVKGIKYLILSELLALGAFVLAALVALHFLPMKWLVLELVFLMLPFLFALFSAKYDHNILFSSLYGSLFFLSLPCALMLFMYRSDLFGQMAGAHLILLVFGLLWVNDIFAYLTGRLLGKHKLFSRISPGKTIEGSLGGLVFTVIAMVVFCHYALWLSIPAAVGMAAIAVIFGTLGDLCESMLKRQAGVKDSGKLIPGHGGVLDRFDSVMFSVPFIFVYLLLL